MSQNLQHILGDVVLDHVAIAVNKIDEAVLFWESLGLKFSEQREVVPSQKVITAFAQIDQHAHIELLEPTSEDSTIAQFIQKKGCGIHHMSFRTNDLKAKQAEMEAKGMKFIYPAPVPGAGNTLVNFIHPKSTGGVLVEIAEKLV
jgi:methylmalonyl-CoA epimerase